MLAAVLVFSVLLFPSCFLFFHLLFFSHFFPPTSYPSITLLAFSFTICHSFPSPSSSFPAVSSLFCPTPPTLRLPPLQPSFLPSQSPPFQNGLRERSHRGGPCGSQGRARLRGFIPLPLLPVGHRAKSKLIGCLSCWGWGRCRVLGLGSALCR